jgi:superfamily II DNA or RNA helicase
LYRKEEVKDFVAEYGQVIVDECHHISAFTFEQVMRQVKAKYVVGVTATQRGRTDTIRSFTCSVVPCGSA